MEPTGNKAKWLRNILVNVPIWNKPMLVIIIYCDNQVVIFKVETENYNGKTRTVRLKYNHMRGLITNGIWLYNM